MSDTQKSHKMRIKSNLSNNWVIYTLFLIIILASFLRLYNLDNLNVIEDTEANKILGMLHVWNTLPGNIIAQFFQSIPFCVAITQLLLSLSAHFLGFSIFSVRLPLAIVGVLIVISVYFLGKELYDERVGLLSAFLLAISPLHLWYTRMIIHHNVTALFIVLALYFFIKNEKAYTSKTYQGKRRRDWITKNKYLLLTVLMIWLGCCNEEPILGVLPVFFLYLLFTQKLGWVKRKELWIGFFILVLPALILLPQLMGSIDARLHHSGAALIYGIEFLEIPSLMIWGFVDWELYPFYLFNSILFGFIMLFGVLWTIRGFIRHNKADIFILVSIAIYGLFFAFYPERHIYYLVHFLPILLIIPAKFIMNFIDLTRKLPGRKSAISYIIALSILFAVAFNAHLVYSIIDPSPHHEAPNAIKQASYYGFGVDEIADFVSKEVGKDKFIFIAGSLPSKSLNIYLHASHNISFSQHHSVYNCPSTRALPVSIRKYPTYSSSVIKKIESNWLNSEEKRYVFWIMQYDCEFINTDSMKNLLFELHPEIKPVKGIYHNEEPVYVIYEITN